MGMLSSILRSMEGNRLSFWCPGCDEPHQIQYGSGEGPLWNWNGKVENPTFTPSILVTTGHYASAFMRRGCWCTFYEENPPSPDERVFKCGICHSFVTDGRIQFLSDCTHELAGQTVDLPPWPQPDN